MQTRTLLTIFTHLPSSSLSLFHYFLLLASDELNELIAKALNGDLRILQVTIENGMSIMHSHICNSHSLIVFLAFLAIQHHGCFEYMFVYGMFNGMHLFCIIFLEQLVAGEHRPPNGSWEDDILLLSSSLFFPLTPSLSPCSYMFREVRACP